MKPATLKRYGLSYAEYHEIVTRQNFKCPICREELLNRKTAIDHEHVRGWKKMKPVNRAKYVRGVLHLFCNRYRLGKYINVEQACNMADYLLDYKDRCSQ